MAKLKKLRRTMETKRMNISVTSVLKDDMDACPHKINWSEVACRAFQERLDEATASDTTSLDDAIRRLRNNKKDTHDADYAAGVADGTTWAHERARYDDLLAMEHKFGDMTSIDWQELASYYNESWDSEESLTLFDRFLLRLKPHVYEDETCRGNFKAEVSNLLEHSVPYCTGFCQGALELWRKVKKEI